MTSPGSRIPHSVVLVAEPVRAHPQHIPGRSHAKRVLLCARGLYPVRVALLAAIYLGAAKLGLTMAAVSLFVFDGPTALFSFDPLACTVFPLVIWAALRFGQPAATLMTLVVSGMAIWGTVGSYIRTNIAYSGSSGSSGTFGASNTSAMDAGILVDFIFQEIALALSLI